MTQKNIQPAVEGLDFQKGYDAHEKKNKPFPGQNNDEPRVLIEKSVYQELQDHAKETVAVELCGILVGTTCQDDSGKYLVISGSIRGKHARNEGAQVAFTHETWDYIHAEMEARFKNKAIVGWYHTHPGFGIFLSDMDKFIQDYFFNQPFQVALVIDPINSKEGLFAWIEGKTRALSRCWVGEEMHRLTQGAVGSEEIREKFPAQANYSQQPVPAQPTSEKPESPSEEGSTYRYLTLALAFLIGFSLATTLLQRALTEQIIKTARAETRELLGAWAADTAAAEELRQLQGKLQAFSDGFHQQMTNSSEFASATAELSSEISALQLRLDEIASSSVERRTRVQSALESVTNQPLRTAEKSEELMKQLRQTIAQSLLVQLTPYLVALSASPPDINRLGEAKALIHHIIALDPRLEPGLKEKLPWLF